MPTDEQRSFWTCDACDQNILAGEYRYNCTICHDYDHCERCVLVLKKTHPHPMVLELAYGLVAGEMWTMDTMATGLRLAMEKFANRHCLGTRDRDSTDPSKFVNSYSWLTFEKVGRRARNFGHGLRRLIEPRGYLGICAANRPEWLITDFACMLQSIISVPIYCLFNERELIHVINNTQITLVVCDMAMLPRFLAAGKECPSLRHLICMDDITDRSSFRSLLAEAEKNGLTLESMRDVEANGSRKKYQPVPTQPSDCLTVIYTSGSSGFPKGAMISEKAYRETFARWFPPPQAERVNFCYRPLAWAADRDAAISVFLGGGRVAFSTGNIDLLMEELALVRPTSFSGAPSIWNKIFAEYQATIASISTSLSPRDRDLEEKRILREFSKLLPTRCKMITVGSAKMSPTVTNFLKRCFSTCTINDSYGITECGGVAYNNMLEGNIDYRLESVPEMGYTVDDKPFPRGEILTRTRQMFSGYINNPEETRAALTEDGFFRTGDIVELHSIGKGSVDVHVIDRKKNFFKLAQGQFVSPEFLQGIYIQSPFVEQIYIHGDLLDDCVSAVVVPNREYAQAFVKKRNYSQFDPKNPDIRFRHAVLQDLRSIAQRESLRKYEVPSRLVIDFEPFTSENGLLTSSMKPCRHKLAAHYASQLKSTDGLEQRLKSLIETTTGQLISADDEDQEGFLANAGADSLTAVRLSRLIEKDLGVVVPLKVLFESKMSLQRLTSLLNDPSRMDEPSESVVPQLWKDVQMDLELKIATRRPSMATPSRVFVTGATGFVGAFLLAELLNSSPPLCKFVCLVRSHPLRSPLDSIRETMLFYQIWNDKFRARLIPVIGDLSKPFLGLNSESFALLADQLDLIFHCGARVNFLLSYHQLYGPNVNGTREIIRLATHPSAWIPVQYISTISVLSSGTEKEISIDQISPEDLNSGYGQSKWVAEKLISRAVQAGLPAVIYRLGSIGASSTSGACNRTDLHTLLLAAILRLGSYPERALRASFNGLPVDFTAKSLVYLSRAVATNLQGQVYHVLNAQSSVSFQDVIANDPQLRLVSSHQWRADLKRMTQLGGPFESVGEQLLDSALAGSSANPAEEFSRAISPLPFPLLDKKYASKWFRFVNDHVLHAFGSVTRCD